MNRPTSYRVVVLTSCQKVASIKLYPTFGSGEFIGFESAEGAKWN